MRALDPPSQDEFQSLNRRASCPSCGTVYPGEAAVCPLDGTALVAGVTSESGPLRLLPKPGSRVQNYRLLEVLGEGSMGRVYLAENEAIGRVVALKMLHPALLQSRTATEAFINEARSVNQIRHRNIIEITDFVVSGGGSSCFLVMERLEGQTLEQLLRVAAPLSAPRAVRIGEQICDALAAAHEVGVIHRDLKPGNVFVMDKDGQADFVKLIDFGVAKILRSATQQIRRTMGGVADLRYIIGTPAYMSPEQATDSAIDHRADIYAVGVLLYEMVTGRLPFTGSSLRALLEAHRYEQPPKPNDVPGLLEPVPSRLEGLILRCLAKEPTDRPATISAVCRTLGEIGAALQGEPVAGTIHGEADWGGIFDPKELEDEFPRPAGGVDTDSVRLRPPRRWWPLFLTLFLFGSIGLASYALFSTPSLRSRFSGALQMAPKPPARRQPRPTTASNASRKIATQISPPQAVIQTQSNPAVRVEDQNETGEIKIAAPAAAAASVPQAAQPARGEDANQKAAPARTPLAIDRRPVEPPTTAAEHSFEPTTAAPPTQAGVPQPPSDPPVVAPSPPPAEEPPPTTSPPAAAPVEQHPARNESPRNEDRPSTPPRGRDGNAKIKVPRWVTPSESGDKSSLKKPRWAD